MAVSDLYRKLKAHALLLRDSALRIDPDELAQWLAARVPDVDLTQGIRVEPDEREPSTPEPITPLERLEAAEGVIVSRDFREAGKGAEWDRVREYDPKVYGWPKNKQRGQSRGTRAWDRISTVVLHTAGVNGLHPDRWLGVPCHNAVANDATVVLCHHLRAYLWAAHAANRYSVSMEVAGNKTITDAQIPAARALLRYNVEELRAHHDGPIYLAPHRFSHKSRVRDCGQIIWHEVGEWGMKELGLELGPVVGSGKPLPFPPPK